MIPDCTSHLYSMHVYGMLKQFLSQKYNMVFQYEPTQIYLISPDTNPKLNSSGISETQI